METLHFIHPHARTMYQQFQEEGPQYTFSIRADHILCNQTQGCYAADSFEVEQLHAFGAQMATRELLYRIRFQDGDTGLIVGMSRELNAIEDPELYNKMMLL